MSPVRRHTASAEEPEEPSDTPLETGDDVPAPEEATAGYLFDYISGARVHDTPEERDAVQVFTRRLVEAVATALDRGDLTDWHRLALAAEADPYGETAAKVEEAMGLVDRLGAERSWRRS